MSETSAPSKRAKPPTTKLNIAARRLLLRKAVRADFEAGTLTLIQIARKHGVAKDDVTQWATQEGWTRPDAQRRNAKPPLKKGDPRPPALAPSPELRADIAAAEPVEDINLARFKRQTAYDVVLSQRQDLAVARALLQQQVAEMQVQHVMGDNLMRVQDVMTEGITAAIALRETRNAIERILALPTRAQTLKCIVDTMQKIHDGERRAVGLKDDDPPPTDKQSGAASLVRTLRVVHTTRKPDAGDDEDLDLSQG
jgi:hypothetical protein